MVGMIETSERLLALPMDLNRGDPARWDALLHFTADHPAWFSSPASREEIWASSAMILSDPQNIVYEVWRGSTFLGVITLTKINPKVDAVVHFVFMDRANLKGKRNTLLNFLGTAYTELGFQRLTFEIPEPFGTLTRFIRKHLGFTYEGETAILDEHPEMVAPLMVHPGWQTWLARVGSRRNAAHWHDGKLVDLMILRQTATEYAAFQTGRTAQEG